MKKEMVLSNAKVVLPAQVISGTVSFSDGTITAVDEGNTDTGEDMGGDYLIPGLVELHTDHLESHYNPRPGVTWNSIAAVQAHDAQIASAGITTVLDCLRMGSDSSGGFEVGEMTALAKVMAEAGVAGRLRAEHFLHLRCEVSAPDVMDCYSGFVDNPSVKLVSMMDHAPGQRQFANLAAYEKHFRSASNMSDNEFKDLVSSRVAQSEKYADGHRQQIASDANSRGITLASHDDASKAHITEACLYGVRVAEFPTTLEAANEADAVNLKVLMGAPNVVRGLSHSGNIGARALAVDNILHLLSSDYIPASLLHAAFVLSLQEKLMSLPKAIALITASPAALIGMDDRGSLRAGLKADVVRVRYADDGVPTVKAVWREGQRVA